MHEINFVNYKDDGEKSLISMIFGYVVGTNIYFELFFSIYITARF